MPEEASQQDLAGLTMLDLVPVAASGFQILGTGNDFSIVFQRARPMLSQDGSVFAGAAKKENVFLLSLSPQSMKDLALVLTKTIEQHETQFGEIKTPYTEELSKAQQKKP